MANESSEPTEFHCALRANEDFMKIPSYFFREWKEKLGKELILEDPLGTSFKVSLHVHDNKAYFAGGIHAIRRHYSIPVGAMICVKYVGNNKFKFRVPMTTEFPDIGFEREPAVQLLPNQKGNIVISWTSKITAALSTGKQALAVKVDVATKLFVGKKSVNVRLDDGQMDTWTIFWTSTKQCRVGHGWYAYCRAMKLKKDDEVCFTKYDKGDYIEVKLTRK